MSLAVAAALACATGALPGQQLSLPSLPKAVQAAMTTQVACEDSLRPVDTHHFTGGAGDNDATLWVVRGPCFGGPSGNNTLFVLKSAKARTAKAVGEARGELLEASPDDGIPTQLFFYVSGQKTETRLTLAKDGTGKYEPATVPHRFRDPLTREAVTAEELRTAALADLKAGSAMSAAGRLSLLCEAECEVSDLETLAAADMIARLFPQAEEMLKQAVAKPGHQAQDWQSLAGLLRAEGKNAEAAAAEAKYAKEQAKASP